MTGKSGSKARPSARVSVIEARRVVPSGSRTRSSWTRRSPGTTWVPLTGSLAPELAGESMPLSTMARVSTGSPTTKAVASETRKGVAPGRGPAARSDWLTLSAWLAWMPWASSPRLSQEREAVSETVVEASASTVTVASKVISMRSPRARSRSGWDRVRPSGETTKPATGEVVTPSAAVRTAETSVTFSYWTGRGWVSTASKAVTSESAACETTRRWVTVSPASRTGAARTAPPASTMSSVICRRASRTVTVSTAATVAPSVAPPRLVSESSAVSHSKRTVVPRSAPGAASTVLSAWARYSMTRRWTSPAAAVLASVPSSRVRVPGVPGVAALPTLPSTQLTEAASMAAKPPTRSVERWVEGSPAASTATTERVPVGSKTRPGSSTSMTAASGEEPSGTSTTTR